MEGMDSPAQLLKDLRAAGAADLLADHVARGHFVNKHTDFHQHPKCREVPRAGNWVLAQLGVPLAQGVCGSASTWTTYGACIETWIFRISQIDDFDQIMRVLVQSIKVLQSLMAELPASMHDAVQWSGTESALQTLLQEYYPYPESGIDTAMGDQNLDPIEVSDTSGSQDGTANDEPASRSATPTSQQDRGHRSTQANSEEIPRPLSRDQQEMVSKRSRSSSDTTKVSSS